MEVSDGRTSIGRALDNAVCLEDDTDVSRYHAAIEGRRDGFWLSDLGSRNGTSINDDPVESERKLDDGDLIRVGGASVIEFCWHEAGRKYASVPAGAPPAHLPFAPGGPVPSEKESPDRAGPSPSPSPESRQSSGLSLVNVTGAIGGLALTAVVMMILFAAGVFDGKKSPQTFSPRATPRPQPSLAPLDDEGDLSPSDPSPREPAEESEVTEAFKHSPRPTPGAAADAEGVAGAAQVLAAKISPKNYQFDATFVRLIGNYVNEYKSAGGFYERARKYRDAIDKEFVNVQGIPPLFGYAMAMSRSKFVEEAGGGGVWRLPAPVVKDEVLDSQTGDPADPAGSTKIAASYIRGLWDTFGRDGFMYAVACYGMTQDEAGEVEQKLEAKDPSGQARYDFWKMKNAGVVKGEEIERVARFFAAGIVMENPQQFGLKEQPLSSLY